MTILKPKAPEGGSELLGQYLGEILNRDSSIVGGATKSFAAKPIATSQPIRVFSVNFDDIKGPDFLDHTYPVGWRYFVVKDGEPVVADIDIVGSRKKFGRVTKGAFAERLLDAAYSAENLYGRSADSFEPRILEIPALYVVAVWLHGPKDVFIPAPETTAGAKVFVDEDQDFLMRVVGLATRKRAEIEEIQAKPASRPRPEPSTY
jgi:hypothetical protein